MAKKKIVYRKTYKGTSLRKSGAYGLAAGVVSTVARQVANGVAASMSNKRKSMAGTTYPKGVKKARTSAARSYTGTRSRSSYQGGSTDTPGSIAVKTQAIRLTSNRSKICPSVFNTDWQGIFQAANGRQLVFIPSYIMPRIGATNVVANRLSGTGYATDLFEMTPRYSTIATSTYNTGIDPSITFDRFFLGKVESTLIISSLSQVAMLVDVYWCTPVKDNYRDPLQAWQESIVLSGVGQSAVATYATAPATVNVPAGSLPAYDQIGVKPSDLAEFKKQWTIRKVDHFNLDPGTIREIKTTIHYNKNIDLEKQGLANQDGTNFITGQTVIPVIVARSAPVLMQYGASAPYVEEMVYAETKVGVMHRQVLKMAAVPKDQKQKIFREHIGTLQASAPTNEIKLEDLDVTVGKAIIGQ